MGSAVKTSRRSSNLEATQVYIYDGTIVKVNTGGNGECPPINSAPLVTTSAGAALPLCVPAPSPVLGDGSVSPHGDLR